MWSRWSLSLLRELARVGNKLDDNVGQLFTLIFLQEMTAINDGSVGLSAAAGNLLLHWLVATGGDWVGVTKCSQERFLPFSQYGPGRSIFFGGRV